MDCQQDQMFVRLISCSLVYISVTTFGAQLVISNAAMRRTKNSNFFITVCSNLFKRKGKVFL